MGNSAYKRSPDRQDVCVRVCLRPEGEAESQKGVGGQTKEEGGGGDGGDADVSVTDSCQENESAVCQPTAHTQKQTRIQSQRPGGETLKPGVWFKGGRKMGGGEHP